MQTLTRPQSILLMAAIGLSLSTFAHASPEKRLIQTQRTSAPQWMTYDELSKISHARHSTGHCGGFMDVTPFPGKFVATRSFSPLFDFSDFPTHAQNSEVVNPLLPKLSVTNLLATVQKLSSFPNRHYKSTHGVDSSNWIKSEFQRIGGTRTDITYESKKHPDGLQPSVIVRIAGNGTDHAERVIIGAHQDSINWKSMGSSSATAPGADDDASGIATLLEVFRVIVESGYQPNRTIEFMAYAGEELGLLGSQDIAQDYQRQGIPVAGVVQFDMTFYPGQNKTMTFMTDYTNPKMTKFMEALVTEYVHVPYAEDQCGYGCSDHASWNEAGYPTVMPFETLMDKYNPNIHTKNDTINNTLDTAFGLNFAKLGLAAAIELSAQPHAIHSAHR